MNYRLLLRNLLVLFSLCSVAMTAFGNEAIDLRVTTVGTGLHPRLDMGGRYSSPHNYVGPSYPKIDSEPIDMAAFRQVQFLMLVTQGDLDKEQRGGGVPLHPEAQLTPSFSRFSEIRLLIARIYFEIVRDSEDRFTDEFNQLIERYNDQVKRSYYYELITEAQKKQLVYPRYINSPNIRFHFSFFDTPTIRTGACQAKLLSMSSF